MRCRPLASRTIAAVSLLLGSPLACTSQTVVGSARVICKEGPYAPTAGPIVGAIINQTQRTITDLEVELSIVTRDKNGQLKRQRDLRFVIIPSLNQTGIVTKLDPNGDVYFSIPEKYEMYGDSDHTCGPENQILNVATLAITRINRKSLLIGRDGKPLKQVPIDSMLQVPRETPAHA